MDFSLTAEQQALKEKVQEFVRKEIGPVAGRLDEETVFPAAVIKKVARFGLTGMGFPKVFGGLGGGAVEQAIILEAIAHDSLSISTILGASNELAGSPIYKFGNEEQKQKYLVPILKGKKLGAFALTEPNAGSDVAALQTTAKKKENGYVINGKKHFIVNGAEAEILVVFATRDKSLKHKGITAFIVEKGTPGFSVDKYQDKMGIRAVSTNELVFKNCFVPARNRLGDEGQGFKIALDAVDGGRIGVAAQAVGVAQGAFDKALAYSKERRQFRQPIGNFQAIQWFLSDMATRINAARLLVYQAALLHDNGIPCIKETCMAKLFAAETASMATTKALQIFGGYGYMKDYPLERYFRDARITEIYEGTSEMQRITIARELAKQS